MSLRTNPTRTSARQIGWMLLGLVGCAPAVTDEPVVTPAGGATALAGSGGRGGDSAANGGVAGSAGAAAGGASNAGESGGGGAGGAGSSAGESAGGVAGGGGQTLGGAGAGGSVAGSAGSAGSTLGGAGASGSAGGSAGEVSGGVSGGAGAAGAAGGSGAGGCTAGEFLCEGFEAYDDGTAPGGSWERDVRGEGAIDVDTARAFSGTKALHVTGTMNADRANIRTPLAVDADTVFVRFMMYTVGYPSSSGVHTRLVRLGKMEGTASGTPESSYAFAQYNGTAIEKVNSIYLRDTGTHLNDADVKNRWVCWEFAIDKTGGVGNVEPHIWLDGTELRLEPAGSSSHGMTSPSWDPIPIEVFILGLDGFQSDSVRADFWIDDLVVHTERIGCPVPRL